MRAHIFAFPTLSLVDFRVFKFDKRNFEAFVITLLNPECRNAAIRFDLVGTCLPHFKTSDLDSLRLTSIEIKRAVIPTFVYVLWAHREGVVSIGVGVGARIRIIGGFSARVILATGGDEGHPWYEGLPIYCFHAEVIATIDARTALEIH